VANDLSPTSNDLLVSSASWWSFKRRAGTFAGIFGPNRPLLLKLFQRSHELKVIRQVLGSFLVVIICGSGSLKLGLYQWY
jgi:hypothetical protein